MKSDAEGEVYAMKKDASFTSAPHPRAPALAM